MDLQRVFSGDGPVAYWRPVDGARHAMLPTERPYPGQERKSLCGKDITITKATTEAWLSPTCAACWDAARALRDEAAARAVRPAPEDTERATPSADGPVQGAPAQRKAPAVRPRTK